jgi:hypothetical protein
MSLEIFVIFHDKIYPEMYEDLEEDEKKCFKFVAVNGAKGGDINEWELPIYDPSWQENKWMNGGVNHHIVLNKLITADYAGFVQYDMKFKKGSINYIKSLLSENVGVSIRTMNLSELLATSTYGTRELHIYKYCITKINKPLLSKNFPLYHMCIMKSEAWYKIMPKVLEIDKYVFDNFMNKETDQWYRFAITSERTLALAIASVLEDVIDVSQFITHERLAGQNNIL